MPTDYEAELDLVSSAITKVLTGGQDVTYNGRRVTRTDLAQLREHRTYLEKKINRQANGGIRIRRGVSSE